MSEPQLARITKATLGFTDHGILSSFIMLEYGYPGAKLGGSGQGFGGYALGGGYGERWIKGILNAVGVDDWSKLEGQMVWVDAEHSKVYAITGLETGKSFDVRDPKQWPKPGRDSDEGDTQ